MMRNCRLRKPDAFFDVPAAQAGCMDMLRCRSLAFPTLFQDQQNAAASGVSNGAKRAVQRILRKHSGLEISRKSTAVNVPCPRHALGSRPITGTSNAMSTRIPGPDSTSSGSGCSHPRSASCASSLRLWRPRKAPAGRETACRWSLAGRRMRDPLFSSGRPPVPEHLPAC